MSSGAETLHVKHPQFSAAMEENAVVFSNDMARLLKQHLPLVLSFINARSEESSSQPLNEAIHSLKNFQAREIPSLKSHLVRYPTEIGRRHGRNRIWIILKTGHLTSKGDMSEKHIVPFKLAFLKDPEGARLVIKCVIRSGLFELSQRLEAIVSQLTLDNSSAASPFSGFIININVCTDGHVNKGDVLCVILLFEFYKKGAVDLVSLDILAF
ncbi:hypothetical protein C8J56DRAFT_1042565 [Mycena floridula]|nr:hypothetical protein C8J56DRAFT_1042565 [Mycena floridula]